MYLPASRAGLGQVALNCPGDPGCPGYVAPGSMEYQTSLLQQILAGQQPQQTQAPVVSQTFTQWMNANSTLLLVGAGGFLEIVFLMKAAR